MQTKPLYVLITDGSDGSYSASYTFDHDLIEKLNKAEEDGRLEYDSLGCAGGSFDYEILNVPVACTAESLGISVIDADDYAHLFEDEEE